MRRTFAKILYEEMKKDERIFLLNGDIGFRVLDDMLHHPRCINCGAAEQSMLGMAIGLAYAGKIPICYTISSFLLYRPFELIRNYINWENLPVKLVGIGRDKDYLHDGKSHWADDDEDFMSRWLNIIELRPRTEEEMERCAVAMLYNDKPTYLNIKKEPHK